MGWSRQERLEIHDRLLGMLEEVSKELKAKYPEITSVDIGLKEKDSKLLEQFCFRINVKEKLPLNELGKRKPFPKEIRGIPTDVIIDEICFPLEDSNAYRPMWGGAMIGSENNQNAFGSLGCFALPNGSNQVQILTNHHVAIGNSGAVGDLVGQYGTPYNCCCCVCGEAIGVVTSGITGVPAPGGTPNTIDAALVRIYRTELGDSSHFNYTNKIIGIGPVFGSSAPVPGDSVRKRGARTEYTEGTISTITATRTVNYADKATDPAINVTYNNNLTIINPTAGFPHYLRGGDSGSVTVNNLNQVVALNFAGPNAEILGIANDIRLVTAAAGLNCSILSSGTAGAIPISAIDAPEPIAAKPNALIASLKHRLNQSPKGQEFLQSISDHHREVLDLINDNREAKVAWNRFQGPSFVGHLMKNAKEPQHPLPDEINGYSFQNLMIKMSDVLERHGSRKLAKAVEDYSLVAFNFSNDYSGINSLDPLLAKYNLCPNCENLKNHVPYA